MNTDGLRITVAMLTNPGRVRLGNEDVVAYVLSQLKKGIADCRLVVLVADGMGGHAAGEVASGLAAERFFKSIRS